MADKKPFQTSPYQHLFLAQKCMVPECTRHAYLTENVDGLKVLVCRSHDSKKFIQKAVKNVKETN